MSETLTPSSSVVLDAENLIQAPLAEELYMMHVEKGTYLYLNDVATLIWNRLREPITVAALCDALSGEFDVSPERCRADVLAFLRELHGKGMLRVVA